MATSKKSAVLRGVAIGDLHLDKLVQMIPNINFIIIDYCRTILKQAVEDEYDVAVFLGDIFNFMTASSEAQRLLLELFVEFQDQIEIRAIEGNHGYRRNGTGSLSTLSMLEEFKLLKASLITTPRCEVIKGVPLLYLPHPYTSVSDLAKNVQALHSCIVDSGLVDQLQYDEADSLGADLESVLYESVAFGHFTRAGSTRDNGTTSDEGVKYNKSIDAKYYIIGHLHTPQEQGNHTFYPGTFYQTSFGEGLKKGYGRFVATTNSKCEVKMRYEHVEVDPPVKLINLLVSEDRHLPKKIAKDSWYKITPSQGYVVPPKIADHPQVMVNQMAGSSASIMMGGTSDDDDDQSELAFDLMSNLEIYLDALGFDGKDIKKARKLVTKASGELGIEL